MHGKNNCKVKPSVSKKPHECITSKKINKRKNKINKKLFTKLYIAKAERKDKQGKKNKATLEKVLEMKIRKTSDCNGLNPQPLSS